MSGLLRPHESHKATTGCDKQEKSLTDLVNPCIAVRERLFRGSGSAPRSPSWLLWSYYSRGSSAFIERCDVSHRPARGLAKFGGAYVTYKREGCGG